MIYEFLKANQQEILELTEQKTIQLAGVLASSKQLREGLPLFFQQLMAMLQIKNGLKSDLSPEQKGKMATTNQSNFSTDLTMPTHSEAEVERIAGYHGAEFLRLGYPISHVVHAYGSMCQVITELASTKNVEIAAKEFHDLNRCLDIAIAGAVTQFQSQRSKQHMKREIEHLGFLAHELRNALGSVVLSLELIKKGTVGFGGSTGKVMERGLARIQELVDRSLTEVRMRMDNQIYAERIILLELIEQIIVIAEIEAQSKNQTLIIAIAPDLEVEGDQHLLYSALSNLIQNSLKFTQPGGTIQVRGKQEGEYIIIEVEDECGGLLSEDGAKLFQAFVQENDNRDGLGLGLSIAQHAIQLNGGKVEARNLPGKGCVFSITIPKMRNTHQLLAAKSGT